MPVQIGLIRYVSQVYRHPKCVGFVKFCHSKCLITHAIIDQKYFGEKVLVFFLQHLAGMPALHFLGPHETLGTPLFFVRPLFLRLFVRAKILDSIRNHTPHMSSRIYKWSLGIPKWSKWLWAGEARWVGYLGESFWLICQVDANFELFSGEF